MMIVDIYTIEQFQHHIWAIARYFTSNQKNLKLYEVLGLYLKFESEERRSRIHRSQSGCGCEEGENQYYTFPDRKWDLLENDLGLSPFLVSLTEKLFAKRFCKKLLIQSKELKHVTLNETPSISLCF